MTHLFIPGPTDVDAEVLEAQTRPMIGHRSQACFDLIARIQPKLRQVFQTQQRVLITPSSGTGLQEAAVRNCVARRLLVCVSGAFGDRFYNVARANGVPADRLDAEWGHPTLPDDVAGMLSQAEYDALAIVHNETSTGVENPLREVAQRAREIQPELLILVDAVSSAGGVRIEPEAWGLDVVLTSSHKCFALPPGLAFAAVSDEALERAAQVEQRGWYFDFVALDRYLQKNATPTTPPISLLYALDVQLDRILAEGMDARFARHTKMAAMTQQWAGEHFGLFAAQGYRSRTVTAIQNTREVDIDGLNAHLSRAEMQISNGYGPLRGHTFRVAHMGETRPSDLEALFTEIEKFIA